MSILFGTNPASALLADASLSQLSYPFTVVAHIKVTNANASISSVFGLGHSDGAIKPVKFSLSPLAGILSVQNNYGNSAYTHGSGFADTTSIYAAGWQLVYMQFDSSTEARHFFNGVEESVTTFNRAIEADKVFPFVGYGSRDRVKASYFAVFNDALDATAKSELATKSPDNITGFIPVFYRKFTDDAVSGIGPTMTDVLGDVVIDAADNPSLSEAPPVNPAFTAQPTTANIGETSLDVSATSDNNCTAQVVITSQGAAQPGDGTFDASSDTATASANTQFTVSVSGLTGLTNYTAWVRLKPVNGTSVYASVDFQTTPAAPTISTLSPATLRVNSTVTVSGSGFTGHTAASIDGNLQSNFTVVDDSTVTFTLTKTGVRHGELATLNIGGTTTTFIAFPALGNTIVDIVSPAAKSERFDSGQAWDIAEPDQVEYETKSDQLEILPDGTVAIQNGFSLPTTFSVTVFDDSDNTWGDSGIISLAEDTDSPSFAVTIDSVTENKTSAIVAFSYAGSDVTGFEYNIGGGWLPATSPLTLTGLTEDTQYDLYIRPVNGVHTGTATAIAFTTNPAVDTIPDPLGFTPLTDVAREVYRESNVITVSGVDAGVDVPLSIVDGEYRYSTNGGVDWTDWASVAGNVRLNYQLQLRQFTSNSYNDQKTTYVTVGTVVGEFPTTTVPDTEAPVFTLTNGNVSVNEGSAWVEPGFTCVDNADGTIPANEVAISGSVDTSTPGTYTLTYTATDNAGNVGTASRIVTVVQALPTDSEAPLISLVGGNVTIEEGTPWSEPGYSATDNTDGVLTGSVSVTGTVDTSTPGTYTLTYSVSDAAGNIASVTRTVTVTTAIVYPLDFEAPVSRTYVAERLNRVEKGEAFFIKEQDEVLDYDFDLTNWLQAQNDTLPDGNFSIEISGNGLKNVGAGMVSGTSRVKVWLSEGIASQYNSSYAVELTVITSRFRTARFLIRIAVVDRVN